MPLSPLPSSLAPFLALSASERAIFSGEVAVDGGSHPSSRMRIRREVTNLFRYRCNSAAVWRRILAACNFPLFCLSIPDEYRSRGVNSEPWTVSNLSFPFLVLSSTLIHTHTSIHTYACMHNIITHIERSIACPDWGGPSWGTYLEWEIIRKTKVCRRRVSSFNEGRTLSSPAIKHTFSRTTDLSCWRDWNQFTRVTHAPSPLQFRTFPPQWTLQSNYKWNKKHVQIHTIGWLNKNFPKHLTRKIEYFVNILLFKNVITDDLSLLAYVDRKNVDGEVDFHIAKDALLFLYPVTI